MAITFSKTGSPVVTDLPSDYVGNAFIFDGNSNNYVDLSANSIYDFSGQKRTVCFWFNYDNAGGNEDLFGNYNTTASQRSYMIRKKADEGFNIQLHRLGNTSTSGTDFTSPSTSSGLVVAGEWYFLTWTFSDAEEMELFINGESVFSQSLSWNVLSTNNTTLGKRGLQDASSSMEGKIAGFKVFDRILNDDEVKLLYLKDLPIISDIGTPSVHYDMTTNGNGDLLDVSGNGNDVSSVSPTLVTGRRNFDGEITGNALYSNSTLNFGDIMPQAQFKTSRTVAIWIKGGPFPSGYQPLLTKGSATPYLCNIGVRDGYMEHTVRDSSGNIVTTGVTTDPSRFVNDGDWHLITDVKDGNTCTYSIDGVPHYTGTVSFTDVFNNDSLLLDKNGANIVNVDDLRIWDKALTQAEILSLYNGRTSDETIGEGFNKPLEPTEAEIQFGSNTYNFPFTTTANEIETALAQDSNIGTGNVSVSGSDNDFQIEFKGTRGNKPLLYPLTSNNIPAGGSAELVESQEGKEGDTYSTTINTDKSIISVIDNSGKVITNDETVRVGMQNDTLEIQNTSTQTLDLSGAKIVEWRNKA